MDEGNMSALAGTIGTIGSQILPHLPAIGAGIGGIIGGIKNLFKNRSGGVVSNPQPVAGPAMPRPIGNFQEMLGRVSDFGNDLSGGINQMAPAFGPGGQAMAGGINNAIGLGQGMASMINEGINRGRESWGQTRDLWNSGDYGGALNNFGQGLQNMFNVGRGVYGAGQEMVNQLRGGWNQGRRMWGY